MSARCVPRGDGCTVSWASYWAVFTPRDPTGASPRGRTAGWERIFMAGRRWGRANGGAFWWGGPPPRAGLPGWGGGGAGGRTGGGARGEEVGGGGGGGGG